MFSAAWFGRMRIVIGLIAGGEDGITAFSCLCRRESQFQSAVFQNRHPPDSQAFIC